MAAAGIGERAEHVAWGLLDVVDTVAGSYVAVRRASSTSLKIWSYAGGSYVEDIKDPLAVASVGYAALNESLQVIHSDPAGLVADGSLLWVSAGTAYVYDPDADTTHSFTLDKARWGGDGWVYGFDSGLRRIRADGSGSELLSTGPGIPNSGVPVFTSSALYVGPESLDGFQTLGKWPLSGATPTDESASPPAGYDNNSDPVFACGGHPAASGKGLWAASSFGDDGYIHLLRWTSPDTNEELFPATWAAQSDPNAAEEAVAGLSLSPGGDVVVYPVDLGGSPAVLRTPVQSYVITDPLPATVVESHGGEFPDYMLPVD